MKRARGFTVVELLVSMALFGLIAAGALSLVLSGNRLQSRSARVDVAQSAVRASLDFMTRDILSASAGCTSGSMWDGAANAAKVPLPISVQTLPDQTDSIELYLADGSGMATVMRPVSSADTQIIVSSAVVATAAPAAINTTFPLFMLTDLASATLLSINGPNTTFVQSATYGALNLAPGSISFPQGVVYGAQSYVFPVRHVKYSVSTTNVAVANGAIQNESMLMMDLFPGGISTPQPLAEGVEDLQIALGFDLNGNGVIDEKALAADDDEWVGNYTGDTPRATLANLKIIRITIVAKTTLGESGTFSTPITAEAHTPPGSADGFSRRVSRTEITVRNFNL